MNFYRVLLWLICAGVKLAWITMLLSPSASFLFRYTPYYTHTSTEQHQTLPYWYNYILHFYPFFFISYRPHLPFNTWPSSQCANLLYSRLIKFVIKSSFPPFGRFVTPFRERWWWWWTGFFDSAHNSFQPNFFPATAVLHRTHPLTHVVVSLLACWPCGGDPCYSMKRNPNYRWVLPNDWIGEYRDGVMFDC